MKNDLVRQSGKREALLVCTCSSNLAWDNNLGEFIHVRPIRFTKHNSVTLGGTKKMQTQLFTNGVETARHRGCQCLRPKQGLCWLDWLFRAHSSSGTQE